MPVESEPRIWVAVPAAGVGSRMAADRPKQYLSLGNKTILETTLDQLAACPSIDAIVVGISGADTYWPEMAYADPKLAQVTAGGKERAHTVLNSLRFIIDQGGGDDWVLVHDAVRACVRVDDIEKLIEAVRVQGQDSSGQGGLLALPVSDTMKRADSSNSVVETLSREKLWRAMTPQMFPVSELADALKASIDAGFEATDESAAMERVGGRPQLVPCQADNIKITTPDDLALAKLILQSQR